jgi:hypothetical protein
MADTKDIMKDLPVAQPEATRAPFGPADQGKVNAAPMPEHHFPPKGEVKVKSNDGKVEFDVSHK